MKKQQVIKSNYWEKIPYSVNIYYDETMGHNGKLHIHDVFECLFVLSDGAEAIINDERFKLQKNSLLFFNRTDLHCIKVPNSITYKRCVLYMDAKQIESCSTPKTFLLDCFCRRNNSLSCIVPLTDEQANSLLNLMLQMRDAAKYESDLYGSDLLIHSLLCNILVVINRLYRNHFCLAQMDSMVLLKKIYSILQFIYENFTRDFSLQELADYACMSTNHLCRVFKQAVGIPPMEYTKNLRMARAKDLLIRGNSVSNTCEMVGYNNLSHFSRQFKNEIGVSPQQYALKNREEESE